MKTVLFLLFCPTLLWAQIVRITSQDTQRKQSYLLMRDGSVVRGRIIRQDSQLVTVRQRGGVMTFIENEQLVRISPRRPDLPANTVQVSPAGVSTPDVSTRGASTGTPERPGISMRGASTPGSYKFFVFKDGTQVEGTFVRRDSTMITVRKRNGQLTYFEPELLDRVDSVRIETFVDTVRAKAFPNRFSPWLLTGQTAHTAEKGRFYYRNTWLLLNEFDYGITRYWSVGVNFTAPIPYVIYTDAFSGTRQAFTNSAQVFTKLSLPVGSKVRLGVNANYRPIPDSDLGYRRGIWTFQALASVGSSQRNVTVGYGLVDRGRQRQYMYWSSRYPTPYTYVAVPKQSFLTLGIMQKVGPGLTLLSDNRLNLGDRYYIYDDNGERATISFAFRIDRKRHAFDLGAYSLVYRKNYAIDGRTVQLLPYVGYNLIIGRDR